jgi:hypothetical protein
LSRSPIILVTTVPKQEAVLSLLKPPAVVYLRKLKADLDRDPGYLEAHKKDVANIIIGFLAGSGFQWHRDIFDREWRGILEDALARLSAKKR